MEVARWKELVPPEVRATRARVAQLLRCPWHPGKHVWFYCIPFFFFCKNGFRSERSQSCCIPVVFCVMTFDALDSFCIIRFWAIFHKICFKNFIIRFHAISFDALASKNLKGNLRVRVQSIQDLSRDKCKFKRKAGTWAQHLESDRLTTEQ